MLATLRLRVISFSAFHCPCSRSKMGNPLSKLSEPLENLQNDVRPILNYAVYFQIAIITLQVLLLAAVVALLITINPDLVEERRLLVTPPLKWLCLFTRKILVWPIRLLSGQPPPQAKLNPTSNLKQSSSDFAAEGSRRRRRGANEY
jgi:hypothetical protein